MRISLADLEVGRNVGAIALYGGIWALVRVDRCEYLRSVLVEIGQTRGLIKLK